VTADEVAAATTTVLDARAGERYRGETEPVDPRAGHVPGARNAPWAANVDPATGRYRSRGDLRRHYEALGAGDGTICYCGSGVSACADVLGIEHAGLGMPRLFVASWSGWSNDPDRPVATGPS
jgi:thiosulfate/3-mercaptopyruvate sulfurtransferase